MFSKRIDRLTSSLVREILALTQKRDVISFAGGLPAEYTMPPFDFADIPPHLRQYGTTEGEPALRQAIAEQVTALGRPCTADQVLITSGSQQGLDLVSKLFIDEGTPVLVESPSYLAALQSFKLFGARFDALPLSPSGVDPAQMRTEIEHNRPAFAYLIPTFQNPSGYCYDRATRQAVAQVLEEHGVPLIEDEPYRELVFDDCDRQPICSFMTKGPWVYLGSFSKTAIPGFRIGFMVCSPELYPYFVRLKQSTDLHTNRIGQWWIGQFVSGPDYAAHLDKVRGAYKEKRDLMAAALGRHMTGLAQWESPKGGLFFWLQLAHKIDTRLLLVKALDKNLAFMPGEPFFPGNVEQSGMIRLNFSHADAAGIEKGVTILAQTIREFIADMPEDGGGPVEI
ncbi:MAG: GntR family transcriptional regulator [Alphaproteobacteria bacterium CG_4_10_14_0_2_um_filter_63_37]|nr:MAG: GntR family transcriptional regulator [Proteobacteria bacterium CG1_02_64_396]PJA25352.1 MAG: GntR family transcriptional regulator [Alphaproteobacteria bacterium CG_4_10_14_0_2_um_filter_63_37]